MSASRKSGPYGSARAGEESLGDFLGCLGLPWKLQRSAEETLVASHPSYSLGWASAQATRPQTTALSRIGFGGDRFGWFPCFR